jgi:hypothetical protein
MKEVMPTKPSYHPEREERTGFNDSDDRRDFSVRVE